MATDKLVINSSRIPTKVPKKTLAVYFCMHTYQ